MNKDKIIVGGILCQKHEHILYELISKYSLMDEGSDFITFKLSSTG